MSTAQIAAIRALRREQARAFERLGGSPKIADGSVLRVAREAAEQREQRLEEKDGYLQDTHFCYPKALELKRLALTRSIVERVVPGPEEDGNYLEMIARQAASVEMILRREHLGETDPQFVTLCDRVLLATTPSFRPGAFARRLNDYFNIQISAGFIEFLYQMTKATIMSWEIGCWDHGVRFDGKPEAMDRVLEENKRVDRMFMLTLLGYLTRGASRDVHGFGSLSFEQQKPATMLTAFNERFVLAHEYSHTLMDAQFKQGADIPNEQAEEFMADEAAFHLLLQSAGTLDGMPPQFAAQGAFFVLTVLDLLRQGQSVLQHGKVVEDEGFAGHPPAQKRYDNLVRIYQEMDNDKASLDHALVAAHSIRHLWKRNRATFQTLAKGMGVGLHPMWVNS